MKPHMKPPTHFIGIGGIGMSGLARLLLLKQQVVSGSDKSGSPLIEELRALGAKIEIGHDPKHVPPFGTIVVSSGIRKDNPELAACKAPEHRILHRSDLLWEMMQKKRPLLVAGSHGKTTTTSLLITVLIEAGLSPSWAVGGTLHRYGTNADHGSGDYFVAEADESDGTHLKYIPYGLILTNVSEDHMDFYKTKEALETSLETFVSNTVSKDHFFWCGDALDFGAIGTSYGFAEKNRLRISSFRQEGRRSFFDIAFEGKNYSEIEIPLMGRHNALNSAAVFGLSLRLGLSEGAVRRALKLATGAKRRLELKWEEEGSFVFDDYAHHPKEIAATLSALREAYPKRRIIVAFQPHRYSRTKDCFAAFGPALKEADILLIPEIYAAGEMPIEGISSEALVKAIPRAHFVPRSDLLGVLNELWRPLDIVVTMGAGDITRVSDEFKS